MVCVERPAEIESLELVAVVTAQERKLLFVLDAFGDDRQPKRMCQSDDRLHDCDVILVLGHVANKGAIDF